MGLSRFYKRYEKRLSVDRRKKMKQNHCPNMKERKGKRKADNTEGD